MNRFLSRSVALIALPLVFAFAMPQVAVANATSTAAWAAAAAAIVGTIFYDGNHRPYYNDRYGDRHYVNPNAAAYYQQHRWSQTPQYRRQWQTPNGTWHYGNGSNCYQNGRYQNRGHEDRGYQNRGYRNGACNNGRGNGRWQDQNGAWHNNNGCC